MARRTEPTSPMRLMQQNVSSVALTASHTTSLSLTEDTLFRETAQTGRPAGRLPIMLRKVITLLLVGAVLLAVAALGGAGLASLLASVGDQTAALAARWAAWILGALWALDLIALLLAVAVAVVGPLQPGDVPTRPREGSAAAKGQEDEPNEDTP